MKQTTASLLVAAITLLFVASFGLPHLAAAQSSGSSITNVDHQIKVMYSGDVVVIDTIQLSAPASDGFMIGLPLQYSASVLKAFAYDDEHVYQVDLGVPFGNYSSFYGAQINFNGYAPRTFTVAFVLNNGIIVDLGRGNYTLNYPAYPSLTQTVDHCHVTLSFPTTPKSIAITKIDGDLKETSYSKNDLPPYTYIAATASVKLSTGSIQPVTITNLNRQITIAPTGAVAVTDIYKITSNSLTPMSSFVLNAPPNASNVVVEDAFGATLNIYHSLGNNVMYVNTTLPAYVNNEQTTTLTATYNLPGAALKGNQYVFSDFELFPKFQYIVEHATTVFSPPEGATIQSPQVDQIDASSTLTRDTFQDTLTVSEDHVSYVDYLTPQENTLQFAYSYNPAWVSFRPTFWAAGIAGVACVGVVAYLKIRPKEETYQTRVERLSRRPSALSVERERHLREIKTGQPVTVDIIRDFLSAYDEKNALRAELKALESKAQKGKIPRRQYKVQKQAIEVRVESLNRSLERTKAVFRGSLGSYPDLAKQLDLAEEDLLLAEENLANLEWRHGRGEISLETFKKTIADYQKIHDKAEAAINGIILRLREKTR